jgi:regulator of ribosome biosynthesis
MSNIKKSRENELEYDLGLLSVFDYQEINKNKFLKEGDYIKNLAKENLQYLLKQLFELEKEDTDEGVLVQLPTPLNDLPRSKPVPKPKPLTKWEKFAKEKGIRKTKKEKFIYSEKHDEFRPTWGKNKAINNLVENDWIIENKQTDQAGVDPFLERSKQKKVKKDLNQFKREENLKRKFQEQGRLMDGQIKFSGGKSLKKKELLSQYDIAHQSTASMGLFDKKLKKYLIFFFLIL